VPIAMPVLVRCGSVSETVGVSFPGSAGVPPAGAGQRSPVGAGETPALPASFARPKSRIFTCETWPRVVIKIFAGLMSRCVMPFECAASSPSAI